MDIDIIPGNDYSNQEEEALHGRRHKPLYQVIADDVGSQIVGLPPHSRLPSEAKIADIYNVSRMTARHGVKILKDRSLVYTRAQANFTTGNHRPIPSRTRHYFARFFPISISIIVKIGGRKHIPSYDEFRR